MYNKLRVILVMENEGPGSIIGYEIAKKEKETWTSVIYFKSEAYNQLKGAIEKLRKLLKQHRTLAARLQLDYTDGVIRVDLSTPYLDFTDDGECVLVEPLIGEAKFQALNLPETIEGISIRYNRPQHGAGGRLLPIPENLEQAAAKLKDTDRVRSVDIYVVDGVLLAHVPLVYLSSADYFEQSGLPAEIDGVPVKYSETESRTLGIY